MLLKFLQIHSIFILEMHGFLYIKVFKRLKFREIIPCNCAGFFAWIKSLLEGLNNPQNFPRRTFLTLIRDQGGCVSNGVAYQLVSSGTSQRVGKKRGINSGK